MTKKSVNKQSRLSQLKTNLVSVVVLAAVIPAIIAACSQIINPLILSHLTPTATLTLLATLTPSLTPNNLTIAFTPTLNPSSVSPLVSTTDSPASSRIVSTVANMPSPTPQGTEMDITADTAIFTVIINGDNPQTIDLTTLNFKSKLGNPKFTQLFRGLIDPSRSSVKMCYWFVVVSRLTATAAPPQTLCGDITFRADSDQPSDRFWFDDLGQSYQIEVSYKGIPLLPENSPCVPTQNLCRFILMP